MNTYSITISDNEDSITVVQKADNKMFALCEVCKTFNIDSKNCNVLIEENK